MNLYIDRFLDGKTVLTVLRQELKLSQNEIRRLKDGRIEVNSKAVTVRHILHEGELLELKISDDNSKTIQPVEMPLEVLYEDDVLIAVNKPSGMPVHPSQGNRTNSLANAIMYRFRNEPFVYRPVNRLDKYTSGPVIIAKTADACYKISSQFASGQVEKVYIAVTKGIPCPEKSTVSLPIGRLPESVIKRTVDESGKPAVTDYEVISQDGKNALVRLYPHTGRTHQIRVHMAAIGCPLLYDFLYGTEEPGKVFMLHCEKLCFIHPVSGKAIELKSPVPFGL